jgi:hypothetical protein
VSKIKTKRGDKNCFTVNGIINGGVKKAEFKR